MNVLIIDRLKDQAITKLYQIKWDRLQNKKQKKKKKKYNIIKTLLPPIFLRNILSGVLTIEHANKQHKRFSKN